MGACKKVPHAAEPRTRRRAATILCPAEREEIRVEVAVAGRKRSEPLPRHEGRRRVLAERGAGSCAPPPSRGVGGDPRLARPVARREPLLAETAEVATREEGGRAASCLLAPLRLAPPPELTSACPRGGSEDLCAELGLVDERLLPAREREALAGLEVLQELLEPLRLGGGETAGDSREPREARLQVEDVRSR